MSTRREGPDGGWVGVYGTESEIKYIKGLPNHVGVGRSRSRAKGGSRLDALKRYLRCMANRYYWGSINPDTIRKFVLAQIAEEEKLTTAKKRV